MEQLQTHNCVSCVLHNEVAAEKAALLVLRSVRIQGPGPEFEVQGGQGVSVQECKHARGPGS